MLGAIRQHATTWTNVDPSLCLHMTSRGHSALFIQTYNWKKMKIYINFHKSLFMPYSKRKMMYMYIYSSWWRHQTEFFFVLLALCEGNPQVNDGFPSYHKGQWRGALTFSLSCAWNNSWANNRDAGDWRRHCAHYDSNVIWANLFNFVRNLCAMTRMCAWNLISLVYVIACHLFGAKPLSNPHWFVIRTRYGLSAGDIWRSWSLINLHLKLLPFCLNLSRLTSRRKPSILGPFHK